MKLSKIPLTSIQRLLIYGPPKSGKTELVGQLAEHFNLIWFDLENGYTTLQKLPLEWQERIELIRIPDTKEFPIAIETCLKVITGAKTKICEAHGKVSCPTCAKPGSDASYVEVELDKLGPETIVIFDSISQLSVSALNNITKGQAGSLLDMPTLDWKDWGKQGFLMDKFLTNVQQAPFNIICIGHDVDVAKEGEKTHLSAMGGTRNFSKNIGKFFGHIVYCEVKMKRHTFGSATTYSTIASTGSRLDVELEGMEKPNLTLFFDGSWKQHIEELQRKEVSGTLNPLKAKLANLAKR